MSNEIFRREIHAACKSWETSIGPCKGLWLGSIPRCCGVVLSTILGDCGVQNTCCGVVFIHHSRRLWCSKLLDSWQFLTAAMGEKSFDYNSRTEGAISRTKLPASDRRGDFSVPLRRSWRSWDAALGSHSLLVSFEFLWGILIFGRLSSGRG